MDLSNKPEIQEWYKNPKYPLLFLEKNGKTRLWACWVIGDTIYRTDGFVNGKLKEPLGKCISGNTLRDCDKQALLEAEKLWLKQIDKDYKPYKTDKIGCKIFEHVCKQKEKTGGMNRGVRMFKETEICTETTAGQKDFGSQHRPMLAKKYKDWKGEKYSLTGPGEKIIFPALIQAKLDGIRALPQIKGDSVMLESRNGNSFVHLNHIRNEIKKFLKGNENIILDGELYIHECFREDGSEMTGVERYQFISEACKITRSEPHKKENLVEYWIFDIWDPTRTNEQRWQIVKNLFKDYDGSIIKLVPTKVVQNHEDIERYMKVLIGEETKRKGYEFEGVMIRQLSAKYMNSTTHQSCLLKYKRFEDEEWEIIDAQRCDGGAQDGSIKWVCRNGKKQLVAKQTGDSTASKKLYEIWLKNPERYRGRKINIRFNDRTKEGIPRFPRATAFVEDK